MKIGIIMKICIIFFTAAFAFIGLMKLAGCKTTQSIDKVNRAFYYGGTTISLVMNETSLSKEKRVVIRDVFVDIKTCNPEVGQPLEAAWTPIAQKHVDALVSEGKIDSATGVVIMAGFHTAMTGVNLLEQHYPEIRKDRDFLSAAISGLTDGFLEHFIVDPDVNATLSDAKGSFVTINMSISDAVRKSAVQNNLK